MLSGSRVSRATSTRRHQCVNWCRLGNRARKRTKTKKKKKTLTGTRKVAHLRSVAWAPLHAFLLFSYRHMYCVNYCKKKKQIREKKTKRKMPASFLLTNNSISRRCNDSVVASNRVLAATCANFSREPVQWSQHTELMWLAITKYIHPTRACELDKLAFIENGSFLLLLPAPVGSLVWPFEMDRCRPVI